MEPKMIVLSANVWTDGKMGMVGELVTAIGVIHKNNVLIDCCNCFCHQLRAMCT